MVFFSICHPKPLHKTNDAFMVKEPNSRKAFNNISSYFMRKLFPLHVRAEKGKIVEVLDSPNLQACISIMEHKVSSPNISIKKKQSIKIEKKELRKGETKAICKNFKSKFLDYLCDNQLDNFNVVSFIEHRVNTRGIISSEYSFIFTIKVKNNNAYLVFENATYARCTYLFIVPRSTWEESIDKLYEFFASNEINKRQSLVSRLIDLHLAGSEDYVRILHTSFQEWTRRINNC